MTTYRYTPGRNQNLPRAPPRRRSRKTARAFDRIVTRPMLDVIGYSARGARYSDLFRLVGICNHPVEEFAYKRRIASSKERG